MESLIKYRVKEAIPGECWNAGDIRFADHRTIYHALLYADKVEFLEIPDEYRNYFQIQAKKPVIETPPAKKGK